MTDTEIPLTQEEAERLGRERLHDVLAKGGKVARTVKCNGCGEMVTVEIETIDPAEMVRVLTYFDAQRKGEGKDKTSRSAQLLLKDLSELTNEELAELTVSLGE